jgi:Integrase core domain
MATQDAQVPYLSTDHDPLYRFHQWLANLGVLEVTEIKTVPYVPLSHPFVERLIGTLRRECLDRTLFWTTTDLEAKLLDFQHYYKWASNARRTPRAPAGNGRQRRSLTRKSQLLSMAEALSRLIPDADGRLILVIHRQLSQKLFPLWSAKIPFNGFQRIVTLLHSDRFIGPPRLHLLEYR